jgi:hypothetical protein
MDLHISHFRDVERQTSPYKSIQLANSHHTLSHSSARPLFRSPTLTLPFRPSPVSFTRSPFLAHPFLRSFVIIPLAHFIPHSFPSLILSFAYHPLLSASIDYSFPRMPPSKSNNGPCSACGKAGSDTYRKLTMTGYATASLRGTIEFKQNSWRPGAAQFCTACYDRYIVLPDNFELPSTRDLGT